MVKLSEPIVVTLLQLIESRIEVPLIRSYNKRIIRIDSLSSKEIREMNIYGITYEQVVKNLKETNKDMIHDTLVKTDVVEVLSDFLCDGEMSSWTAIDKILQECIAINSRDLANNPKKVVQYVKEDPWASLASEPEIFERIESNFTEMAELENDYVLIVDIPGGNPELIRLSDLDY